MTYLIIFVLLLAAELVYFRIADKFNIIDKPNERSSHSTIVLRGGGVIFLIGAWVWSAFFGFAARLGEIGGAVRCCGDGVLSAGNIALVDVVDSAGGADSLCGGYKCD